ncbi:hypothetical protein Scep_011153 [Stephania cephalantha]|uniref:Pentatricopeptide repeat-containing protein n=1 Tax=Stephania cephalantha TaxID=152367 RepID=A0AAP0JEP6_9MAGN
MSLTTTTTHPHQHLMINSTKHICSWASAIKNSTSPQQAMLIYTTMQRESITFTTHSILFTLKACSPLQNLPLIRHLHAHLFKLNYNTHVYVGTSLLYAYVIVHLGDGCRLFDEMPDKNTITWNTMLTGYSKVGNVQGARVVFDSMPAKDIASWSAMIAAYMGSAYWEEGLSLFRKMMVDHEEFKPDEATLGPVLSKCSGLGSLGLLLGRSIHGFAEKNGWELKMELGTQLVDMYFKCGFLGVAFRVFERMKDKSVASWTAIICGLVHNGHGESAMYMFERMKEAGVRPNEVTLTGVLGACTQLGLVDEGLKIFHNLIEEYRLEPQIQHYGCMVDLLGRAGRLEEAFELINTMRLEPNVVVWSSFLAACKVHRQLDMAERVIQQVLKIVKPENHGGVFTMICDLYALGGKWDEAQRVREMMVDQKVRKARGSSFIRSGTA